MDVIHGTINVDATYGTITGAEKWEQENHLTEILPKFRVIEWLRWAWALRHTGYCCVVCETRG